MSLSQATDYKRVSAPRKTSEFPEKNSADDLLLDTKNMLDFCRKSGYFPGIRKRHEISMLSEGPSIILGKSYRMLLQQKQVDPKVTGLL